MAETKRVRLEIKDGLRELSGEDECLYPDDERYNVTLKGTATLFVFSTCS
jgi:hypothetical protein